MRFGEHGNVIEAFSLQPNARAGPTLSSQTWPIVNAPQRRKMLGISSRVSIALDNLEGEIFGNKYRSILEESSVFSFKTSSCTRNLAEVMNAASSVHLGVLVEK